MKPDRQTIKRMVVVLAMLTASIAAGAAPGENSSAPDFGSGIFGKWIVDEYGMPAYLYTMRHDDPRAEWDPKTEPVTNLMWHQLGNDRVNANAYNLGFVKLFYHESGAMWLNEYEPERGAHSGGFGWLIDGATVLVDRDELVPPGAEWERVFGAGYFRKRLRTRDLELERVVFAPRIPAMLPLLVSEVTIENLSGRDKEVTLIEYWDVNTRLLTDVLMGRGIAGRRRDQRVRVQVNQNNPAILSAETKIIHGDQRGFPDRPEQIDPELPAVFLASLDATPEAWITDPAELFDGKTINMDPAALGAAGSKSPDGSPRQQKDACLAARLKVLVPAGGSVALRFEYGYAKGFSVDDVSGLALTAALEDSKRPIGPRGKTVAPTTMAQWAVELPGLDLPRDNFIARELKWDYYYLVSSSLFDAYYQRRRVPQGANYLYYSGMDGATRDFAAFVQALAYYRPELAREILEFMARCQDADGRLFYDFGGYGVRYNNPYRPGDLDIWFLWALCEYVFATRDFEFLDQVEPFYPLHKGDEGTMWEHARRSLDHLVNVVGTGRRGHPRLKLSDWNDEMTWLASGFNPVDIIATVARGESVMNTAMCCVTLPMVADLSRRQGDSESARLAEDFLARMREALDSAWTGEHLVRAYSGLGRPFGEDEMYLEPQAWALLEPGILPPEREEALIEKIRTELIEPSEIGMMISTSTSGSVTTRPGEQEEGGIWFAINGPAAVALSRFDRGLGWDEVKRNSLGWHGHVYPETWYGIWSGPDAWNSVFSDRPSETWYMKTPIINTGPQMYPVQNAHAHCQTMWAVARMAGITPRAEGWVVDPRIPMERYSFDCALYSLQVSPGVIGGRVKVFAADEFEIRVKLPEGWRPGSVSARVGGRDVPLTRDADSVAFKIRTGGGRESAWEVGR